MSQDFYATLGVSSDATTQDIKRAFRQIARECHPDVAGDDPAAAERFTEARKAYETLLDPVTRARYDRRGQRRGAPPPSGSFFDAFYKRTGEEEAKSSSGGPAPAGFGSTFAGGDRETTSYGAHDGGGHHSANAQAPNDPRNNLDLDDLFADHGDFGFGASRKQGAGARPGGDFRGGPPRAQRGSDVHVEIDVPFATAQSGGSVSVSYYRLQRSDSWAPGSNDPGVYRVQEITEVRLVPGTRAGDVLRERGLGDAGAYGGPWGDLVVRVKLQPRHEAPRSGPIEAEQAQDDPTQEQTPEVRLDDHGDEVVTLEITVVEALLGGRVACKTPQGKVRLTIPPCSSSGTRMRLKGKGTPGPDGSPGELYVELRIVVPKTLDDESRRLIEEFAKLNP